MVLYEENVRNMMVFAENTCTTMDHALSTITQDELTNWQPRQSLFTSLGDEERRKARAGNRGDWITIEELEEEDRNERSSQVREHNNGQMKRTATYVMDMYKRTREEAGEHPFLAGALTAAGLPFIGWRLLNDSCPSLVFISVASMLALALMIEKYYPEHAKLTLELCSNFIQYKVHVVLVLTSTITQMSKLWFLLLKISARQVSVVAVESFKSWYEYASTNGFMATGLELASTGCSLGFLGASYLYQVAIGFTKQALE
ncbi:LOW QUALITY PROTEIN: Hypothetical protein PHPALM_10002 [Phytophthora palmivora]|uniref:Uncharacterized protein n=1 Tax=Phytophthora palmivora TaxID=4796 RepID=A0A2P4Y5V0_9STRA|nr:LOW QUALITY PROTEIN: Hypothetical protein PHPALM_10002 [Phytophthora palmivora]